MILRALGAGSVQLADEVSSHACHGLPVRRIDVGKRLQSQIRRQAVEGIDAVGGGIAPGKACELLFKEVEGLVPAAAERRIAGGLQLLDDRDLFLQVS